MSWWKRIGFAKRSKRRERAASVYSALIKHARDPWLFTEGGLEDDLEGRFNALTLVSGTLLSVLGQRGPEGRSLADLVYRQAFDGLDAGLRETGVGDASIARKVRKFGEVYFGVGQAIHQALMSSDPNESLDKVISTNGFVAEDRIDRLSAHLLSLAESFEQSADRDWLSDLPS